MNRVKKKSNGKVSQLKVKQNKKAIAVDDDSYDSMVDNGTDEDDDDDPIGNGGDSVDSGHESGAYVRIQRKPTKKASKAAKRKILANEDEEEHRKRLKTMKALTKPLTVEEINRLKETENYYHSNLFRMQTEQMMREVCVTPMLGRFVQAWVQQFKEFLQTIEDGASDRSLLELGYGGIRFPLKLEHSEHAQEMLGKERFRFIQQHHVRTVGGCDGLLHTSFGKPLIVDLLLVIPDRCLQKEDYLNLRYHYKRAHYLCTIAEQLEKQQGIVAGVHFVPLKGDCLKHVLVLEPANDRYTRKVHFHLNAVVDGAKFLKKRFLPHRNNVRPAMLGRSRLSESTEEYEDMPTPHYNSSILYDIRLVKNSELLQSTVQSDSVREAIILLKVWARQRKFDRGRYGFDGGLITFYIALLLQNKRIYPNMSSYQIIRHFWNQLAASSWDKEGISFETSSPETLASLFRFYDVVFLDPMGTLNLTANLPVDLYRRVRHESALAIRLLDNRKINSFLTLFLASYPAYVQYDHIVTLADPQLVPDTIESFAVDNERLDYIGDPETLFARMVERLLRRGLGNRISFLVPLAMVQEPNVKSPFTLGIDLNGTEAFNLIDKGPEAIDAAASEAFRAFWHGKAELRRFKDGTVTESCVWGKANDPVGQKRLIVRSIVLFLLQAHFDIPNEKITYLATQFETAVQPWTPDRHAEVHETVEERSLAVIRSFDSLGRIMRELDKLPLTISAILGTEAVFRYSDPDPPRPMERNVNNYEQWFLSARPIHATIQLQASGKWPMDLGAIRRLKTAFYLRIADCLGKIRHTDGRPIGRAYTDYLDVLYEKYLFRFVIIHQREIAILRECLADNKVTRLQQDNEESAALEMQATVLPKLTGILHGLHQQYFSFGSVAAIAKRWLYSQLIDPYLWPDECTELLLAAMYLNQPLQPPVQPQTGFLRWLHYVASTDWSEEMIVVNLNDELSSATIEELEKQFFERRKIFPPLTIVTPCDSGKYGLFGRRAPSVEILNRVTLLAQAAIGLIETSICNLPATVEECFRPSLQGYNVIIHLDHKILAPVGVRGFGKNYQKQWNRHRGRSAGFDPVGLYLHELREAYRQFAIFFYDPCGGDRIAVLWRPQALEVKAFKANSMSGRLLNTDGALQLNVDALVRDFEIIGQGLVSSIDRM